MGLVGTSLQGLDRPSERVGVTRWRQFLAADIASEVNTARKTSITDSGGEIQYAGTVTTSGSFKVQTAYQAIFTLVNPDTGATVTWSDGEFTGAEVWIKYGTVIPDEDKAGLVAGLINTGTSKVLAVGTTYQSSNHRITAAKWASSADVNMTFASDDRIWGQISAPSQAGGTNVLLDLAIGMQMDDSTSPTRVQSSITTKLEFVTSSDLKLILAFGGSVNAAVYYRLNKTPIAPA